MTLLQLLNGVDILKYQIDPGVIHGHTEGMKCGIQLCYYTGNGKVFTLCKPSGTIGAGVWQEVGNLNQIPFS